MSPQTKFSDIKYRIICSDGKPYHNTFLTRENAVTMRRYLDRNSQDCGPHRIQVSPKRGRAFKDEE